MIHTKMVQADGTLGTSEYAMKIIEKRVITREKKVRVLRCPLQSSLHSGCLWFYFVCNPASLACSRNLTHLFNNNSYAVRRTA